MRTAFRDRVADGALMARIVRDIKDLLLGTGRDVSDNDALHLWDEFDGHVAGGINWATDYADHFTSDSYAAVTGPDLDDPKVPW